MSIQGQEHKLNKENDEISLRDLIVKFQEWWHYLLSKWITIVLFGLIGAALGFSYAFFKKSVYTATTTFVLEDEKGTGSLGNLAGLASIAGFDIGGGGGGGIFQGDNLPELYKSRTMIEKTLLSSMETDSTELLIDRYITFNDLRSTWTKNKALFNLKFEKFNLSPSSPLISDSKLVRLRDSVLGVIVNDINKNYLTVAKPDKKLSIIQVDVKAKDEIFAKTFNDRLVKNVNQFFISTKTKKTLQNVLILQHKTDSVRAVMNGAIYSAAAISDATPNLNPTRQVQRVAPAQKAQFSAETNKSILAEMVKNLELTKMSLLKETPLIQVIDEPIYPIQEEKTSRLKGMVFGGMLFSAVVIIFLILRRIFKNIMG